MLILTLQTHVNINIRHMLILTLQTHVDINITDTC
jgi:hypothetical protein